MYLLGYKQTFLRVIFYKRKNYNYLHKKNNKQTPNKKLQDSKQIMQKLIQRSKEFFAWLNDVMHPIKSAEMLAKWQESRKPIVLFFLVYSLILRVVRISILKTESNLPIDTLRKDYLFNQNYPYQIDENGENGVDISEEQYKKDIFWVMASMGATATLNVFMILGVYKSRLFLYVIPWVILVDKWVEYPIRPVFSAYLNYGLAFFS